MFNQTCYFGLNPIDGCIKCYDTELYVRYVRGSNAIGVNNISVDAGQEIVTDVATGLSWTLQDSDAAMNWAESPCSRTR